MFEGTGVPRVCVVVLGLVWRLEAWGSEAKVRLDRRVAHCLQMLGSARRRPLAKDAAIFGGENTRCNRVGRVAIGFGCAAARSSMSLTSLGCGGGRHDGKGLADRARFWPGCGV